MIYQILKIIFRVALKLYFRKININFYEEFPKGKSILFVANHPSSFMDALLIAAFIKRPLHFMSRGESFNSPWKRWIFSYFNMHPIYRKEHSPGLVSKNTSLINGFQQLLLSKHSILIFPEGISHVEPWLYPLKTGAARVILGAEENDSEEILLVPIGLNYENPHRFRSKVIANFGKAIDLAKYRKEYSQNKRKAVHQLTEKIKSELENLIFNIENEELHKFVPVVQSLYERELVQNSPITLPKEKKRFRIRKDIILGMHFFEKKFPSRSKHIKKGLREYQKMLKFNSVKDNWLDSKYPYFARFKPIYTVLYYVLGFPLFLYGLINHLGPMIMPRFIVKAIIKRPDFRGSLLLAFGALCFLIFYMLQFSLLISLTGSVFWAIIYLISLPITGCFALYYFRDFLRDKDMIMFKIFLQKDQNLLAYLKSYREQLLQQLRAARTEYLHSMESNLKE